jgi:hypothetical protein
MAIDEVLAADVRPDVVWSRDIDRFEERWKRR